MMERMRAYSETFVSKILIFVLGASFIFWGISGNILSDANLAIQIGDRKVSVQELDLEMRRQVAQMQNAMGSKFDYKQALSMGLLSQIIDNMVYRIAFDIAARQKGIVVSPSKIYDIVQQNKVFQDESGNFSPEKFAFILDANNVSEADFVREAELEVAREILLNSVISNIDTIALANILFKQANELRVVDIVSFKIENEKIVEKSNDEQLREIYNLNIDKFLQPEYRKISYITVSPSSVKKSKSISDDEGGDMTYKGMLEISENIIDEVNSGSNIDSVVKEFGVVKVSLPDLDVEGKRRGGLTFTDKNFGVKYRDIAFFALDEKGISDPIDAGDNIILVIVESVYKASPKAFDSVKKELAAMWLNNMQISQAARKALEVLKRIESGDKVSSAVLAVDSSANVILNNRIGRASNLYPSDFLTKLFNSEVAKPFSVKDGNVNFVAVVRGVEFPEVSNSQEFSKFSERVQRNFTQYMVDDYINYLNQEYGVEVNDKSIKRLL